MTDRDADEAVGQLYAAHGARLIRQRFVGTLRINRGLVKSDGSRGIAALGSRWRNG